MVELPKDMDPTETAPLMCAGLTLFNGIRRQNILSGDIIVISGVGGLGHLGLQYASKMGYKTVAISSSASKRDLAMELGASAYIDGSKEDPVQALQEMGGAALIIETSGNPETMSKLLGGLAPGGQLQILTGKPGRRRWTRQSLRSRLTFGDWQLSETFPSTPC